MLFTPTPISKAQAEAALVELQAKHTPAPYRGIVYHYTNIAALEGILHEWFDEQILSLKNGFSEMANKEADLRSRVTDPDYPVDLVISSQRLANLERWVGEVCALVKDPDFRNENEWRCVYVLRENTKQMRHNVKFRNAGTRMIPFVEFSFIEADPKSIIHEIIVGPSQQPDQIFDLVQSLQRQSGLSFQISSPQHAFRNA